MVRRTGIAPPAKVGVLGLTYKPATNVTEFSQALIIVRRLLDDGYKVNVFDPMIRSGAPSERSADTNYHETMKSCIIASKLIIFATPWPVFHEIEGRLLEAKTVIDCWRILKQSAANRAGQYMAIGEAGDTIRDRSSN
jgi:UDPglucose 6-dehydrogenase